MRLLTNKKHQEHGRSCVPVNLCQPRPRGFALIANLIIMAMLALLGVASMTATVVEVQISANLEDGARSFQAAEAGVSAAEMLILSDTAQLAFSGTEKQIDFSSVSPNPLANLIDNNPTSALNDVPVVTAVVSGDPEGKCARSEWASSDDLIGCGAFDIVSTHGPLSSDSARGGAHTTVRLGVAREVIATQ